MLKECSSEISLMLALIYNESLAQGTIIIIMNCVETNNTPSKNQIIKGERSNQR